MTMQKHSAEISRLKESLGEKEKTLNKKADERLEYIQNEYTREFSAVKRIVGREMENLIEITGAEVLKKDEKPAAGVVASTDIVREVNETDEGTLLYYLHSHDPDYYKEYERKKISKAEAIFKAKELMAKEKGLSDSMVKKYFSSTED
jgi:hypothetical protein